MEVERILEGVSISEDLPIVKILEKLHALYFFIFFIFIF